MTALRHAPANLLNLQGHAGVAKGCFNPVDFVAMCAPTVDMQVANVSGGHGATDPTSYFNACASPAILHASSLRWRRNGVRLETPRVFRSPWQGQAEAPHRAGKNAKLPQGSEVEPLRGGSHGCAISDSDAVFC